MASSSEAVRCTSLSNSRSAECRASVYIALAVSSHMTVMPSISSRMRRALTERAISPEMLVSSLFELVSSTANRPDEVDSQFAPQVMNMHLHRVAAHFGAPAVEAVLELHARE